MPYVENQRDQEEYESGNQSWRPGAGWISSVALIGFIWYFYGFLRAWLLSSWFENEEEQSGERK